MIKFLNWFKDWYIDSPLGPSEWNLYEYLTSNLITDMSIMNNQIENFHQIYKSYIYQTNSAMSWFYEMIRWEECLAKRYYDDPSTIPRNRNYPITQIMKQLIENKGENLTEA